MFDNFNKNFGNFIKQIPNEHLEFVRPKQSYTTSYYATVNSEAKEESEHEFNLGDSVSHKTFGEGVVLSIEGSGDSSRIQVNFYGVGTKWLVAAYASLERAK